MRALTLLIGLLLFAGPLGVAAARGHGEIAGTVINITCPGPCRPGDTGPPFQGEAIIEVRRARGQRVVARALVSDSQFAIAVRPGRYQVTVIPYPMQQPSCWRGSTLAAHVQRGESVTLRLTVANGCVV
jgi:hypothetical protein